MKSKDKNTYYCYMNNNFKLIGLTYIRNIKNANKVFVCEYEFSYSELNRISFIFQNS